ncbi:MAG: hypothetical protein PHU23_02785 [Dehalococcoidales bacterium]|nr:hypothetical protein [Dehalococcoidales bacterium]
MSKEEKTNNDVINEAEAPVEKKKSSFGQKFLNFLMMGGFLLILIVGVIIAVAISMLAQGC